MAAEDKRKAQRTAETHMCPECSAVGNSTGQAAIGFDSLFAHCPVTEHCIIRAIENSEVSCK